MFFEAEWWALALILTFGGGLHRPAPPTVATTLMYRLQINKASTFAYRWICTTHLWVTHSMLLCLLLQ